MNNNTYKIVLIGDGGVGKTTYVNRLVTGDFQKKYLATIGVNIERYICNTTNGEITFNIWDIAGQEWFSGLGDYWMEANAFILMFDLTSNCSFKNLNKYLIQLKQNDHLNKPLIVCGNKLDLKDRKVDHQSIVKFMESVKLITNQCKYFDISARSNYNFEKPFLNIARSLTQKDDLTFIESDPIKPPEVMISNEIRNEFVNENCNNVLNGELVIDEELENDKYIDMSLHIDLYDKIINILTEKSPQVCLEFKNSMC